MALNNRKRLKKNYVLMVDNLQFSEIQDYLYERDVIDDEEMELIGGKPTKKGQIRELIKIVGCKIKAGNGDAFICFCEVLRDCPADYGYIANILENTQIEESDEDLIDGSEKSDQEKVNELMKQLWTQTETMMKMREQHQLEISELLKQLGDSTDAGDRRRDRGRAGVSDRDRGSALSMAGIRGSAADVEDEPKFVDKCVTEFIQAPSKDDTSMLTRLLGLFWRSEDESEKIACHLGRDIILYSQKGWGQQGMLNHADKYTEVLRHVAKEILDKYGQENTFISGIDVAEMTGYSTIDTVFDELFEDGKKVNWGRIAAWYVFWANSVSKFQLQNHDLEKFVDFYGRFIGFYLSRRLRDWIKKEGGWDAFIAWGHRDIQMLQQQSYVYPAIGYFVRGLVDYYRL